MKKKIGGTLISSSISLPSIRDHQEVRIPFPMQHNKKKSSSSSFKTKLTFCPALLFHCVCKGKHFFRKGTKTMGIAWYADLFLSFFLVTCVGGRSWNGKCFSCCLIVDPLLKYNTKKTVLENPNNKSISENPTPLVSEVVMFLFLPSPSRLWYLCFSPPPYFDFDWLGKCRSDLKEYRRIKMCRQHHVWQFKSRMLKKYQRQTIQTGEKETASGK